MWYHYVYIHYKADNDVPFYVGKGHVSKKAKEQVFKRANEPRLKNLHWANTVKTHGLRVAIFASCSSDEEAQRLEKVLIAEFGRKDLGRGSLINRTDGGEGSCGMIISPKHRERLSVSLTGRKGKPFSLEQKEEMSRRKKMQYANGCKTTKGYHHTLETKAVLSAKNKGRKAFFSEEHKANISAAKKNKPSTLKGKKRPPFSSEWRANLSAAATRRYAKEEGRAASRAAWEKVKVNNPNWRQDLLERSAKGARQRSLNAKIRRELKAQTPPIRFPENAHNAVLSFGA